VILDTSILLAALDAGEPAHHVAVELMRAPGPKIVPGPVVVETSWLIRRHVGGEVELAFLSSLDGPVLVVEEPAAADRARVLELLATHRDLRLGYVDAATIAIAERLGEHAIATLDRRNFSVVRPRHVAAFTLVPDPVR